MLGRADAAARALKREVFLGLPDEAQEQGQDDQADQGGGDIRQLVSQWFEV